MAAACERRINAMPASDMYGQAEMEGKYIGYTLAKDLIQATIEEFEDSCLDDCVA
jgi:hypothetical protein